MKAELVPKDNAPPIPLVRDSTVVGRHPTCEIVLDDVSLSKRHALFIKTDGLVWVRDLASTNGMRVNGQKVHWGALLPGDTIALGRLKFTMYLGPDDRLSPSELLAQRDMPPPSVSSQFIPTAIPQTRFSAGKPAGRDQEAIEAAEFIPEAELVPDVDDVDTRRQPMSGFTSPPAAQEEEFLLDFDDDDGLNLNLDAKLNQSPKPSSKAKPKPQNLDEDEDEVIFPMIIAEE